MCKGQRLCEQFGEVLPVGVDEGVGGRQVVDAHRATEPVGDDRGFRRGSERGREGVLGHRDADLVVTLLEAEVACDAAASVGRGDLDAERRQCGRRGVRRGVRSPRRIGCPRW